jgi:mRNA interferase HigB
MHVISKKILRQFWQKYPDSQASLTRWFKIVNKQSFSNFSSLRSVFPSADQVGNLVVFNIGGNKYRLIASAHFNRGKIYVRHILTHLEYDKGNWKT